MPVLEQPDRQREAFTQIMAIAGQALPPAVFLSYGYLATNSGYTAADIKKAFWKTVTNLGVVWGLFSVVVIVAGATALHNVYTGDGPDVSRRAPLFADRKHPGGRARCSGRRFLARWDSSRRASSRSA